MAHSPRWSSWSPALGSPRLTFAIPSTASAIHRVFVSALPASIRARWAASATVLKSPARSPRSASCRSMRAGAGKLAASGIFLPPVSGTIEPRGTTATACSPGPSLATGGPPLSTAGPLVLHAGARRTTAATSPRNATTSGSCATNPRVAVTGLLVQGSWSRARGIPSRKESPTRLPVIPVVHR